MIRLQQRERGIYIERFNVGVWGLLTIVDTEAQAIEYIKQRFRGEIYVQLQTKRENVKGTSSQDS